MKLITAVLLFIIHFSLAAQPAKTCSWNMVEIKAEVSAKLIEYKEIIDSFRTRYNKPNAPQVMAFIWPIKPMPDYSEVSSYYLTNNFVDQDNTTNIQDWNCGSRTYDGHNGIDIDLWPFTWRMMDNNYVAAIAAAPGVVVLVRDNLNNENNCGMAGENLNGNYVAVRHADNSTSFYFHIRDNTAKVIEGQVVNTGDILAFVGSSGFSSNPHMHFEVNDDDNTFPNIADLIDPYAGTCNSLNAASWWQAQKPYWEPAVVRVMTHSAAPSLPGFGSNSNFCRSGEIVNARAAFGANDPIHFGVAMRDYLQNQSFTLTVQYPNGTIWFNETNTNNTGIDLRRQYYTFQRTIPGDAPAGTYKAIVNFNGTNSVYFFSVNCPVSENVTSIISGHRAVIVSSTITSTALLFAGNRLLLQAGSKITLSPGFITQNGSVLKARIRDCNYSE